MQFLLVCLQKNFFQLPISNWIFYFTITDVFQIKYLFERLYNNVATFYHLHAISLNLYSHMFRAAGGKPPDICLPEGDREVDELHRGETECIWPGKKPFFTYEWLFMYFDRMTFLSGARKFHSRMLPESRCHRSGTSKVQESVGNSKYPISVRGFFWRKPSAKSSKKDQYSFFF